MTQMLRYLKTIDRKVLFLLVIGILLLFNLGRLLIGHYADQQKAILSQQELLARYEEKVRQLPDLKKKIRGLKQGTGAYEKFFFRGPSVDKISSDIQIKLQGMVSDSGLKSESVRPVTRGKKAKKNALYQTIAVKLRLAGTMDQFVDFMTRLYAVDKIFMLENFTLKPHKKEQMKIYLEVKGYYLLQTPDDTGK